MESSTLQQAVSVIKSGDKETGRRLLAEVIRNAPRNETAWLWMSSVVESDEHRRTCLERVLAINPDNTVAQRGLAALTFSSHSRQSSPIGHERETSQPVGEAASAAQRLEAETLEPTETSQQPKINGLAITSLVLGILAIPMSCSNAESWTIAGIIVGNAAIIIGLTAWRQIGKSRGIQRGRRLALAGIVVGCLVDLLIVLGLLLILLIVVWGPIMRRG